MSLTLFSLPLVALAQSTCTDGQTQNMSSGFWTCVNGQWVPGGISQNQATNAINLLSSAGISTNNVSTSNVTTSSVVTTPASTVTPAASGVTATVSGQSDFQAQLQALLDQLHQILQQINQLAQQEILQTQSTGGNSEGTTQSTDQCPTFWRTLSVGMSGGDVEQLQQLLSSKGFFEGETTGYFGSQTLQAVQEWQQQNGIATSGTDGWGTFGTLSRQSILSLCGGGEPTSTSGADATQSSASTFDVSCSSSVGVCTSGDSTNTTSGSVSSGTSGESCYWNGHMYANGAFAPAGTVGNSGVGATATCSNGNWVSGSSSGSAGGSGSSSAGSSSGGSVVTPSAPLAATPMTGHAPLQVNFTQTLNPAPSAVTIYFGDGGVSQLFTCPAGGSCTIAVSHTYITAGNYASQENVSIGASSNIVSGPVLSVQ